ncbi:2,3-bisphosphoglycerate-dependent phosphoglycerate mutase [Propionibacterium cyclohexanicum]|uniref:2,3-bisphosphoglycerate-dependent phosphoglycerate mutase n=1 Tax=Propionibacterium cyclohexanicum TaxID=64702 RepID=A0A1H9RQY4_9ACTN|nr:histidine phosphatase family protein [Propionibacterium cyclohexanicum]SER74865.1 2,3-bisphosphoglycerate-dependent phosphoglycerate mutase [Propionibacterium cyclohexanicum]
MKLLLIRHGQSTNNVLTAAGHPFRGRSADPELTALGLRQSLRLTEAFTGGLAPRPTVLVSSPMVRAVQTAAPLADELDLPIVVDTCAYEVGGVYAGEPGSPAPDRGAAASRLLAVSERVELPDDVGEQGWYHRGAHVEEQEEAQERGRTLYASLLSRGTHDRDVIALVCHEWIIQYLIRAALHLSNPLGSPDPWFIVFNTATVLIETGRPKPGPFEGTGTSALWWVNRHDHLDRAEVTH